VLAPIQAIGGGFIAAACVGSQIVFAQILATNSGMMVEGDRQMKKLKPMVLRQIPIFAGSLLLAIAVSAIRRTHFR
jgi:hypothetical protein